VLNQTAAWWFENTTHIVQNAVIWLPDPNVTVMKKCTVFPVEFVCRGYLTGSPCRPQAPGCRPLATRRA
jgi:phosphoribosylaminoimidazole-succinocarboxamide synthase